MGTQLEKVAIPDVLDTSTESLTNPTPLGYDNTTLTLDAESPGGLPAPSVISAVTALAVRSVVAEVRTRVNVSGAPPIDLIVVEPEYT